KVVTTGGIYGRIVEVKETYIVLEIAKEVQIKVDKNGIVKDMSDATPTK
ncbi:MAG TPA: preprotein translocase subunit YajC, partial [Mariniphaga sp.]|nr:preprotein translocase subunit YajC [Mariniphaga sp.]